MLSSVTKLAKSWRGRKPSLPAWLCEGWPLREGGGDGSSGVSAAGASALEETSASVRAAPVRRTTRTSVTPTFCARQASVSRNPSQAPAALKQFDRYMRLGPREFSWFIYRVTNPIMRDFFMGPQNRFRVKEAVLSVLAGDIFGKTPIWPSILLFKCLYYAANLLQPRRALRAWKQRRFNIRKVDDPALYNA